MVEQRPRTRSRGPCTNTNAGWSSPVARQAHNLKVPGSNPGPATTAPPWGTAGGPKAGGPPLPWRATDSAGPPVSPIGLDFRVSEAAGASKGFPGPLLPSGLSPDPAPGAAKESEPAPAARLTDPPPVEANPGTTACQARRVPRTEWRSPTTPCSHTHCLRAKSTAARCRLDLQTDIGHGTDLGRRSGG